MCDCVCVVGAITRAVLVIARTALGAVGGGGDSALSDSRFNNITDLYSAAAACPRFHTL